MVEFAAVRFLDRLNRAATKVYASSRAIFSVAHFLASCLFQTDSSPRGGPLRRDEKPRPLHVLLHVHRHRDELKVPVVAIQAEIARVPSLDPPRRLLTERRVRVYEILLIRRRSKMCTTTETKTSKANSLRHRGEMSLAPPRGRSILEWQPGILFGDHRLGMLRLVDMTELAHFDSGLERVVVGKDVQ